LAASPLLHDWSGDRVSSSFCMQARDRWSVKIYNKRNRESNAIQPG
jgi:hypothetical protein